LAVNAARTNSAIADVAATLNTEFDPAALLVTVAEHALFGLDASWAAVLLRDRRPTTGVNGVHVVTESLRTGTTAEVDLLAPGPGLVSARDGVVTLIDDLAAAEDSRWPRYRREALAAGLRAVRAFPIVSLQTPLGSIVIHTDEPWGSARSSTFGQILASLTATALSSAAVHHRRADAAASIEELLDGGRLIASATGMLAEVLNVDVAQARRALARLARAYGVSVTAHSRVIVEAHNRDPLAPKPSWAHLPDLPPPRRIDRDPPER
jgi:GAF domain-containing protein